MNNTVEIGNREPQAKMNTREAQQADILSAKNLYKSFKDGKLFVDVLSGINFSVKHGETIAILGASGSGKSTLLHLLGGLDKPSKGEVFVAGTQFAKVSEAKRSQLRNQYLGFVYQFHHLLPEFTVLENVSMPLFFSDVSPKEAEARARELLEKVGLGPRLQHKPPEISGGERQRTAVVRALINNPVCVLADEPTGNLDSHTAEQVFETMLELNKSLGTSLLIVTHDQELAAQMDRQLYLVDGQLTTNT